MKYIAAIQTIAALAIAAGLAIGLMLLYRWIKGGGLIDAGNALKASPVGVPARTIDAGISAVTGREVTLGGWLAEIFDKNTRAVAESLKPVPFNPYSINPRLRN